MTFHIPLLDLNITLTPSAVTKWTCPKPETQPLYPDPTVYITPEFLNLHPSIASAALPIGYADLSADEANALLDPYDSPDSRE